MQLMSDFYPQALFTFILLTIYEGLLQQQSLSQLTFCLFIFFKVVLFLYSHRALEIITAARSSISTLNALSFLWVLLSLTVTMFFSILCLILFHIQPGEEHPMPQRMKRLLELIFIFCAMPMAFSECVMCYHQALIMQLKCKKFKSSALLALSAVCTLPKALLEQIHGQFWSKITTCFRKRILIDDTQRGTSILKCYSLFYTNFINSFFPIKNCII